MNPLPTPPPDQRDLPHLDEDGLLGLLLGRLAHAESISAIAHVASCPECEDRLRERGAAMERLRISAVYHRLVEDGPIPARLGEEAGSAAVSSAGSGRNRERSISASVWRALRATFRRPAYVTGLAMGLVAVVGVLVVLTRPEPSAALPSQADWLPVVPELAEVRSGSAPSGGDRPQSPATEEAERTRSDLQRALADYERRDLDPAIAGLRSVQVTGSLESLRRIYLGNALAHRGDFAEAAGILRGLPFGEIPDQGRDQARWTLLVALGRAGRRRSADSLLRALRAEPGELGDRARHLPGRQAAPPGR